jgi:hypothetical protein
MEFIKEYGGLIALALGVLARMLIPWLLLVRQSMGNGDKPPEWKWRYLFGQLIGVGVLLIGLPLLVSDLKEVMAWPWQAAWLAGYGAAELGRLADKSVTKFND